MTPKEKALELVHKFLTCKDYSNSYYVIPIQDDAKQCVLIAVDEIINNSLEYMGCNLEDGEIIYWQQVKQEIEKL
jgi:hypothetical protein